MKVITNKLPLSYLKCDIEKTKVDFIRVLYVLSGLSVIYNTYFDIVFGIKALIIILISVFISRETEIFFTTQKNDVHRKEAKETLATTKPEVTGLIYALLLPVGTPIFVVAVGAFISIFVGKMIFGGYSFNVFNPAIVGRLFVGIAWPGLVTLGFPDSFDNYLLELIFNKDLSGILYSPLMELQLNGVVSLENMKSLFSILFLPNNGYMFAVPGIFYIIVILYFAIRKSVDLAPLIISTVTTTILISVIIIYFNLSISYLFFNLLAGGFLFVSIFMMNDPFTKPFNNYGFMIYATIFTMVFTLIRFLGKDADGVLNALLFSNLFVPLLNKKYKKEKLGFNKKSILTAVIMLFILILTGLFINAILQQRIDQNLITVNAYVKS